MNTDKVQLLADRTREKRRGQGREGKGRIVHVVRAYLRFFNLDFSVSAQEDAFLF